MSLVYGSYEHVPVVTLLKANVNFDYDGVMFQQNLMIILMDELGILVIRACASGDTFKG